MIRKFFATIVGIIAGALLSMAIGAGLKHRFPDEFALDTWDILWGEHWFLRALASMISSACAGYIVGIIAREKGKILAVIAVLPSWILWISIEYAALFRANNDVYVSLGNKIFIGFIILAMLPIAWKSGKQGEIVGQKYASFYDSRKHSLLGIKWYHYLWFPFVLYLIVLQGSFSGFYFLTWLKALWQSGFSFFGSIIPAIFTILIYGTLWFMAIGVYMAYLILAGFINIDSKGIAALTVTKYAIGFQIIAGVLQFVIEYIHYSLAKWLS